MEHIWYILTRMHLSCPLATLLPAADAGALTVLVRTEAPLTGRRVAELAGARNHTSTLRALNRLSHSGIVSVEPAGRARLYRFNRRHVLAPAIEALVQSVDELRMGLIEALKNWPVPCLHASLYGSVARGQAGEDSDIDVLVVRPDDLSSNDAEAWDRQLADLETATFDRTGNHLSWLETTVADLQRADTAGEPIFQSWRDDAIRLVGPSLTTLLRSPAPTGPRP